MDMTASRSFEYRKVLKKRFMEFGLGGIFENEALELLLTYTHPRQDVRGLVEGLMAGFGEFQGVLDAPIEELVAFPGMDVHSAILLKATRDCCGLYLKKKTTNKQLLNCWLDLIKYCQVSMAGLKDEQFRVVFLNSNREVIEIETLHEGTLDQTVVYPRKVMERALHHKAAGLVFVHNHPHGYAQPSMSDKEITYTLVAAATSMDIEVHDHLIICRNSYFSFRDEGMLVEVPERLLRISLSK